MSQAPDLFAPIVVAGIGDTGPSAEDPRSIPEMVLAAVEEALADAALPLDAVDAVVTASVDLFDGLTASNIAVTEVVGAVMRPETRIAADGLCAAVHAACQIWAGAYDTVLVVAHGKASMAPQEALTSWAMDPIHLQPLGVDFLVCAGLVAQALAAQDSAALERWAGIAAERLSAAARGGKGVVCEPAVVRASKVVAAPLTEQMCAPPADAACAVILRRADPRKAGPGVRLTGVGYDLAAHALGSRDLKRWEGLERACGRALDQAGIPPSPDTFDLLEPAALYPHEEELFLRAVGAGAGARVSAAGGLFAGAAPVAAGLGRLVAATRQLRQDDSLQRALAHGCWGPAGQGQVVTILEAGA